MTRRTSSQATPALVAFLDEHERLLGLLGFIGTLVSSVDRTASIASKYFAEHGDDRDREEAEKKLAAPDRARAVLRDQYAPTLSQLVMQRAVDNFLAYIADLLKLVFTLRPESLRSSETVKLEDALAFPTLEELIVFLAERKVDRLAYRSLDDLANDLEKTLGLQLFREQADLSRAVQLVEVRNLITHNRGVVNAKFLRDAPDSGYAIGDRLSLDDGDEFLCQFDFLRDRACDIDERAAEHFALPRDTIRAPIASEPGNPESD